MLINVNDVIKQVQRQYHRIGEQVLEHIGSLVAEVSDGATSGSERATTTLSKHMVRMIEPCIPPMGP